MIANRLAEAGAVRVMQHGVLDQRGVSNMGSSTWGADHDAEQEGERTRAASVLRALATAASYEAAEAINNGGGIGGLRDVAGLPGRNFDPKAVAAPAMAKGFVNWSDGNIKSGDCDGYEEYLEKNNCYNEFNNEFLHKDCAASVLKALATAASYEAADATNADGIVDWSLCIDLGGGG